jgi:acyl-CoA dehydrogenase
MESHISPWMDAELELYRDNVRRFIKAEVVPYQQKWRDQHYVDREVWRKAGELGLLLADVPEEYGGGGGTFAHMAVFWEELIAVGETTARKVRGRPTFRNWLEVK